MDILPSDLVSRKGCIFINDIPRLVELSGFEPEVSRMGSPQLNQFSPIKFVNPNSGAGGNRTLICRVGIQTFYHKQPH